MSTKDRGIPFLLLLYVGVLGTIALGAGYAYSYVTFENEARASWSHREKTILDGRIATAREIKEALRKPIPRPEPLPPITAKPERAPAVLAGDSRKPQRPRLSKQARDAFASGADFSASWQPTGAIDRHAVVSQ